MKKIGIPIEVVVTHEYGDDLKELIRSSIINLDKWEQGEEPLIYEIFGHRTSQILLRIKQYE